MSIDEILMSMRTGAVQRPEQIHDFIQGVVDQTVTRPQAAAWLAWAFQRGLTDAETVSLTRAMTHTGDVLSWGDGPPLIDKHSTGGVGDKVSLVLAPLWAELGLRVPMISGRGLGHTGGTLDKLEAISGFRTNLEADELRTVLNDVGCFITGQTGTLAPADSVLYGLRNETCTVPSIPLVVGSILSKKLAEGTETLVLDVKVGNGGFSDTLEIARELATVLVRVANGAGLKCTAQLTSMERPLGRTVGNGLEVEESIACLQGNGPADLIEIVVALANHPLAAEVLASGACYDRFERMVAAQGGSLNEPLQGAGCAEVTVVAERSGIVQQVDAYGIGRAAFVLGAGRLSAGAPVDFGVGLRLAVSPGDVVEAGQPLFALIHRDGHQLELATKLATDAVQVGIQAPNVPPLLRDFIRLD
ncbi:MAG: thymidine phosphorylase [Rhodobacterales bacterium]|nr:thymidine phosphorylase [Rhodobacterales bacterium]